MQTCTRCGRQNRPDARFCDLCGAALAEASARQERKTVSILFCDVSSSTELGERADAETVRAVLARYFAAARAAIERHGGAVEKFIGDAVMAVFGVPVAHEDDALRALRAALDIQAAVAELSVDVERNFGTRFDVRVGVNTGEVVTGTAERLATGDAVNVASRLEQAAPPGGVLIGEETRRAATTSVDVEAVAPLTVKGKREPLRAYRLLAVRDAETRPVEAPLVARRAELEQLSDARRRGVPRLTVIGDAGIGKSRLATAFVARLRSAVVLKGRCRSYGEGITYGALVEALAPLDVQDDETLRALRGETDATVSPAEVAAAVRGALVSLRKRVVLVLEDVHWAEPTFLDLVDEVSAAKASIFVLCLARPELLERRPAWRDEVVALEPLTNEESVQLVDQLAELDDGVRAQIVATAEGNPLFLEELVALAREGGDVRLPRTIQFVLAARLDQLDPDARAVLQHAAVQGREFEPDALAQASIDALVDAQLVVRNNGTCQFRHQLIHAAAYDSLPKAERALLHERHAQWLVAHRPRRVDLDELVGYHLERAYRYRTELWPADGGAQKLAQRAAVHLGDAGRRAHDRGDPGAGVDLLGRALELLPGDARPPALERMYWSILYATGRTDEVHELVVAAAAAAARAGDRERQAHALRWLDAFGRRGR